MGDLLVGEYLLKRLQELGIKSVFGVPGDYELAFLDLVLSAGLSWKGNPNELVASYAADGYARVNGVGAFVTTFGPGETSALCGVAGSYTEFVPVVHIVGYPSMKAQRKHAILHHTLGEGRFDNYHEMSKQICCATTVLEDAATSASEIDRVLNAMLHYSQPVYIGIPTDVTFEKIADHGLLVPLSTTLDPNDPALQDRVITDIRARLGKSSNPVVVVDGAAARSGAIEEVAGLVEALKAPVFTTPMGKGSVNEQLPSFKGTYSGAGSKPDIISVVEGSDCVLWIGRYPADLNTGEFSEKVAEDAVIDFQRFSVKIGPQKYNVKMQHVLKALVESLKADPIARETTEVQCQAYGEAPGANPSIIKQDWMWPNFGKFLRPGDLVVVETGTSAVGFNGTALPANVTTWTQEVFGSIGYATGAMVGATVAHHEKKAGQRSILITGDGSLQLTVQALADLLRHGTNLHIFVINNDGYTVERVIHGKEQPYNDIPMWKYTEALKFFGPNVKSESYRVSTPSELNALLNDAKFGEPSCPKLVEIVMDKFDAPLPLLLAGNAIDKFNSQ